MTRRPAMHGLVMALALAAPSLVAAADGPRLRAAPGTVVRWSGEGLELCGQADEDWKPLGDSCFYPVDLLREPGTLAVYRYRNGVRETASIEVADYPYPVQRLTIEDDTRVELSPESLERVGREQRQVASLWPSRRPRRFELPLAPPLAKLPEGGSFGSRRFFNDQPRSPHSGADYAAPTGEPVYAVADGTVRLAAELFFSGNSVFVDHGEGLVSMYFHLSEMSVSEGEQVVRGETVGRVGATGRVTGPHLHFGLRWRGARIDPSLLLGAPERVPELASSP